MRKLAKAVAVAWPGEPAPRVRLLPDVLPMRALPGGGADRHQIPIGVDESTLAPVLLDFGADAHFLVFGDTECGKSNLLRLIAESVVERYTPDQARLIFIDYRRSLLDSAETEHRIGYAASSAAAGPVHQRRPRGAGPAAAAARPDPAASCAAGPGGRARTCSWSSTTTISWRA